jgi:hypothetical protein
MLLRLWGQNSGGPRGDVLQSCARMRAPISPPPSRKVRVPPADRPCRASSAEEESGVGSLLSMATSPRNRSGPDLLRGGLNCADAAGAAGHDNPVEKGFHVRRIGDGFRTSDRPMGIMRRSNRVKEGRTTKVSHHGRAHGSIPNRPACRSHVLGNPRNALQIASRRPHPGWITIPIEPRATAGARPDVRSRGHGGMPPTAPLAGPATEAYPHRPIIVPALDLGSRRAAFDRQLCRRRS